MKKFNVGQIIGWRGESQRHSLARRGVKSGKCLTHSGYRPQGFFDVAPFPIKNVPKTIGTAAGDAYFVKTEVEDKYGRWNDDYKINDGYWVVHEGNKHHIYKVVHGISRHGHQAEDTLGAKGKKRGFSRDEEFYFPKDSEYVFVKKGFWTIQDGKKVLEFPKGTKIKVIRGQDFTGALMFKSSKDGVEGWTVATDIEDYVRRKK